MPLQIEFQLSILSSILAQTSSHTLHTIYASYPKAKTRSVTPPSHFTIFIFLFCSWSSLARFREFQDKVELGIASLHFKEAIQVIISLWNILHCKARFQLNRYIHAVLSPLLGIVSFRFVKKICHNHSPEHAHIVRFHLYYVCCKNFESEHGIKVRSEIGGEEILPHLRELSQVLYMVEFVFSCSTLFMLWVLLESPGIKR